MQSKHRRFEEKSTNKKWRRVYYCGKKIKINDKDRRNLETIGVDLMKKRGEKNSLNNEFFFFFKGNYRTTIPVCHDALCLHS